MIPGTPSLENAELVDWTVESGDGKIRIRIKEGATIELQTVVMGVLRVGNDPTTGLPTYSIQSQQLVKLVTAEKNLRKSKGRMSPRDTGSSAVGFH
jgi:hypothetical protein